MSDKDKAALAQQVVGAGASEETQRFAIEVEKMLCEKLGRKWAPAGMSIQTLIDDLVAAPAAPLAKQQTVLEGWKLVPVIPTPEMIHAAQDALESYPFEGNIRRHYRAMLAAAPQAEQQVTQAAAGVWVEVPGTPASGERMRVTAEGAHLFVRDGKYYQFVAEQQDERDLAINVETCAVCGEGKALLVRSCSCCGSLYAGSAEMRENQKQAGQAPAEGGADMLAAIAHSAEGMRLASMLRGDVNVGEFQSALLGVVRAAQANVQPKGTPMLAPAQRAQLVLSEDQVGQLIYDGNTVSYIKQRANSYGDELMACWGVLRDAGLAGESGQKLHEALRAAIRAPAVGAAHPPVQGSKGNT